jgi:hypothetical protein
MKTIDTLISDVEALFEGHSIETGIEKFSDKLVSVFVTRFADYAEERKPTLRLSNIGKPLRQLWYQLKGYEGEALPAAAKMKFLYGDVLEELLLFLAVEAGHTVERLQQEVRVDGIKGHIDAVIDGVLVDCKSCSSFSFKKFESKSLVDDDPFGYVAQLSGYSIALGGIDAAFWAVDKVLGHMCLCRFSKEELSEYDVSGRIEAARESLKSDDPPARCYEDIAEGKSGNRRLGIGCSYCPYKFECWKDANDGQGLRVFSYSTGPKFLTHIEREPRVDAFDKFPTK